MNDNYKEYFENGEFKLTRELINKIPCISSITYTTYAVNKENKLVSWGSNGYMGKVVEGLENETVLALSVGYHTMMAVTNENKIYFKKEKEPAKFFLQPKEKVQMILLNIEYHTEKKAVIICENSHVYNFVNPSNVKLMENCLGLNINLACFDSLNKSVIFASLYNKNIEDDKLYLCSNDTSASLELLPLHFLPHGVRMVNIYSSGGNGSFIHLENGRIISFGSNGNGALGRKSEIKFDYVGESQFENRKFISACSMYYTSILNVFNENKVCELYGFGYNANGELGLGSDKKNL
eukprot:TRINITY_DN2199_c0_g1_i1.p1 TRINITY_DN2199_c0_g1~~TRINITY_DN2199_c0_g1_i1.p1  ORF type:complete len:294 (-),score=71.69 TRINITY_DN2199_c0_g1_i1:380-1261(-)